MRVYLCEKPSQGSDVAKFLGMTPVHKKNGFFEKDGVVVTWAVGHLFKLAPPEKYAPELAGKWSFDSLPIFPERFEYVLGDKAGPQYKVIKGLLQKAKEVYIATDPDPEGEKIARNILRFAGYKGVLKRVLYSATDKKTLTAAFAKPIDATQTEWMHTVATARSEADWIVGMNLTIAMTLCVQKLETSSRERSKKAFPIGRVKWPACMLVLLREQKIRQFKPVTYYEIEVDLQTESGAPITLNLQLPERMLTDGKLLNRDAANKAVQYIKQIGSGVVSNVTSEVKKKSPPLPYELSSLQTAADKYGIAIDDAADTAQSLYASPLSVQTYPRTEIPYLPEGLLEDVEQTVVHLVRLEPFRNLNLDLKKRTSAWNDKKVKVHHGIIPNTKECDFQRLTPMQQRIYLLVAARYLAQFMPDYEYNHASIVVTLGNVQLTGTANTPLKAGWKSIDSDGDDNAAESAKFPQLTQGDRLKVVEARVLEKTTRKPSRYTTASLAAAMSNIAAEVEDPKMRSALEESSGIGTTATRPSIIKESINAGLLGVEGKFLAPGSRLEQFYRLVPENLQKPENTALWEQAFNAIRDGKISTKQFLDYQKKIVASAVNSLKSKFEEVK